MELTEQEKEYLKKLRSPSLPLLFPLILQLINKYII